MPRVHSHRRATERRQTTWPPSGRAVRHDVTRAVFANPVRPRTHGRLGAPGVLINENATIAGGTIMGSHDNGTAILLRNSNIVTINGNANIAGNIAILGDNASVSLLSGNASGSIDFYDGTSSRLNALMSNYQQQLMAPICYYDPPAAQSTGQQISV